MEFLLRLCVVSNTRLDKQSRCFYLAKFIPFLCLKVILTCTKNLLFTWPEFISTSADANAVQPGGDRIIFEIEVPSTLKHCAIPGQSAYKTEPSVLFLPYATMRVVNNTTKDIPTYYKDCKVLISVVPVGTPIN